VITGRDYGTSHSYRYEINLSPAKVNWLGGSSDPKHILICPEEFAMHYVRKNIDHENEEVDYKQESEYIEFVDQRFFFKLVGDSYWKLLSPEAYKEKSKHCKEYKIPNDGELLDDAPDRIVNEIINHAPLQRNL